MKVSNTKTALRLSILPEAFLRGFSFGLFAINIHLKINLFNLQVVRL
nr:MAG TPA: hypothetical protein [Bacteriophage sp.]